MAWTAPRTWVHNEVVTASMMNAHVRDNELVLKTTRDAAGRVSALSSATLGNLSGANLTGVAFLAAGNAYTDGRSRYLSAARIMIPVGTDKWTGTKGVDARGWWVEGEELHHIAQDLTTEYKYTGEIVGAGAPGGQPGSVWVEGDYLHYLAESSGNEHRCQSLGAAGAHSDVNAIGGSTWVETFVHWVRESGSQEMPGHADVAHSDGTAHDDTHSDVAHSDVAHADVGHADSHGDAHTDVPGHADSHGDHNDVGHADTHGDFSDHSDVPHSDSHTDTPHSDTAHSDSHTDSHTDHSDHGDAAHADQPVAA